MKKEGIRYTFIFALIVCVICSLLLTIVSEGLREKKETNRLLDIKKNILKSVNLEKPMSDKAEVSEIEAMFSEKIEEKIIDEKGNVVEGKTSFDIKEGEKLYPIYIYKEAGQIKAYSFPIVGKGLWSTLYGYFALESDAKKVRGITFYSHGETPGLGAEIEKKWFQNNFKGKNIWDDNENVLWPVKVIKGKVNEKITDEKQKEHSVDGISGATITSRGVTEMIKRELEKYEPFFSKIRE